MRCSACPAFLRAFSFQASSCLAGLGTSVEPRGLSQWRPSHGRRNRETVRCRCIHSQVYPRLSKSSVYAGIPHNAAVFKLHNPSTTRDFAFVFRCAAYDTLNGHHHPPLHDSIRPRTAQPAPQQGIPSDSHMSREKQVTTTEADQT